MEQTTTEWHRSSFCSDGACVEVASINNGIAVRDGKNPEVRSLWFDKAEWNTFLNGVVAGDFRSL